MKILFIADHFPPEVSALANRAHRHAKLWVEMGAEVTIITCVPNFPYGKVFPGYRKRLRQVEYVDGIRVVRVWSYMAPNKGVIRRTFDQTSFAISATWFGLFEDFDIAVASSGPFFVGFAGLFLSKLKRRPWIFEIRDLWPESVVAVGAVKRNAIIRFFEHVELFFYRSAKSVVALTPAFKSNLVSRGIDPNKVVVIENGVDEAEFFPREKNQALLQQLNLVDKFVVGYLGTIGMAHALDFIVRCAAKMDYPRLHLLIIGDGAEKAAIVDLANKLNLNNVSFVGQIPRQDAPEYLALFDVALIPLKKSDTFKTVIPSKIFEAAAMRKPILLGVDGQARELVERFDCGLFFEPENMQDFLAAASNLAENVMLREQLCQGCDALVQTFGRKRLAREMLDALTEAADKKGPSARIDHSP